MIDQGVTDGSLFSKPFTRGCLSGHLFGCIHVHVYVMEPCSGMGASTVIQITVDLAAVIQQTLLCTGDCNS